jgi:type I restriction-modification system DNA methylase subunit
LAKNYIENVKAGVVHFTSAFLLQDQTVFQNVRNRKSPNVGNMSSKQPKENDFRKILQSFSPQFDTRRIFDAFMLLTACALAAQTREAEYLEEAKKWDTKALATFGEAIAALVIEMESKPFEDVIGAYYMDCAISSKGQQWGGEFHTPKSICDLMAKLALGDMASIPIEGPITVCEPACGAGAMILSFAETCPPDVRRRLRVTAMDINRTACDMAFINTTLWGIPTRIIHCNTLTMECWAAWSNIHYILPWMPLAMKILSPEARKQGQPPTTTEMERIKAALAKKTRPSSP